MSTNQVDDRETSANAHFQVALGERSYDILIGTGLLAAAGGRISEVVGARRAFVVTDSTVAELHLPTLARSLRDAGVEVETLIVPAGEASKSFAEVERLTGELLRCRIERSEPVVALGGGVIGDLAGFAAAVVLRGVPFVQVPTTLLAQVDSSVGGKTGINTPQGKNLVGAFYQPRLVIADVASLATLPKRELLAGYAEVVKYALIDRPAFFDWLETHGGSLIAGDAQAMTSAVEICCQAKAEVVASDERESGRRQLLNLGHTFAHALEAECGYDGRLLHGEAVAIGMVLAFELSSRLGLCPVEDAVRVRNHLARIGLPTDFAGIGDVPLDPERLMRHMKGDKKVRDGRINFVLVRGIGRAFVSDRVEPGELAGLLADFVAGTGRTPASRPI